MDAVAEIEIDAEAFGLGEGDGDGEDYEGYDAGGDQGSGAVGGEWHGGGGERAADEWRRGGGERGTSQWHGGSGDRAAGGWRRGGDSGERAAGVTWAGAGPQDSDDRESVPWAVDAWSPDYAKVWPPLSGSGREPRPGLLLSVVRAGAVVAYPTPLPDPPTGALARALARLERPHPSAPKLLPVQAAPPQPRRPAPPKTYGDVRALVGIVVEVLVGRRAATHAARFTDPEVRGKLRKPHYPRTAALKSVRLAESGNGVEATALLQDRGRTRVVALRFDRAADSRWCCTALQTG